MLDNFYISVFNSYKARLGKRANRVALFYINLLEISIYLAFGAFSLAFANQMNIATITMFKFWVIIGLVTLFIMFKNWMRYNGKKRNVLKAKSRTKTPSVILLWLLPLGGIILSIVFLQVLT
ncbi:hypothetical protein [Winogradskyella sp.]|uniref:hypothetical protein n=1 Tax=Winogradskyella sp. TaxID=1883156 RepID=UPI000C45B7DC|nr:hypothetical protein [uncultured Winogradskyella sp.]MBL85602.1 hypothetical protein [Winogradskyella sp.]|tara:strand:+ start:5432 stop:5797 length:366 start_codon:yes stop_codon:yes gene_type:complete